MTRARTTFKDRLTIHTLLQKHLILDEDSGLWRFEPGWNDERVAKTANKKLNAKSSIVIRRELFGRVRSPKRAKKVDKTNKLSSTDLASLHARMEKVEQALISLDQLLRSKK